jgi:hypothetical protein
VAQCLVCLRLFIYLCQVSVRLSQVLWLSGWVGLKAVIDRHGDLIIRPGLLEDYFFNWLGTERIAYHYNCIGYRQSLTAVWEAHKVGREAGRAVECLSIQGAGGRKRALLGTRRCCAVMPRQEPSCEAGSSLRHELMQPPPLGGGCAHTASLLLCSRDT